MILARRPGVETDAETYGLAVRAGPEHEVQVAGLEVERDARLRAVRGRVFLADRPLAAESPFVQRELRRHGVVVRDSRNLAARRREVVRARVADVGLGAQHVRLVRRERGAATRCGD